MKVLVTGTYVRSEAYPNVLHRLERMSRDPLIELTEEPVPLVMSIDYGSRLKAAGSLLKVACSICLGSLRGVRRAVAHRNDHDVLYAPYPSIGLLLLLGMLPRRLRPRRVVADMFISVYDTIVLDRGLVGRKSLVARVIRELERRACRVADVLVVDTPENVVYTANLLSLPVSRFAALPLAIDENEYGPPTASAGRSHGDDRVLRVLFVGNLVPLHGIDVLCDALPQVDDSTPIHCTIVGNGQCREAVEDLLSRLSNSRSRHRVQWITQWQSPDALSLLIAGSDLCVGILAANEKSSRVWPFKNYVYMACGAVFVTAATPVASRLADSFGREYFLQTDPGSSRSVARTLESVARNRTRLEALGASARQAYDEMLSEECSQPRLRELLGGTAVSHCTDDARRTASS